MQLYRFMHYPNIVCRLAMMRLYDWIGRGSSPNYYSKSMRLCFLFGAINLVYQNFGMIIYLCLTQPKQSQLSANIALISETICIMGLTLVGSFNMWMLLHHRKDIEFLFTELQELYPETAYGASARLYRITHYYKKSRRLMKYTAIFFMSAYAFYNGLPIVELIYELLVETEQVKYKYQSNTWYPWQPLVAQDSAWSFALCYFCQAISSLACVTFIMAGQFLLCFFITQMQLHFDALANAFGVLDASHPLANSQLKTLIAYHIRVLRIAHRINSVFNITFLVNFCTSTIAICFMAFSMVMINLVSALKFSVGLLSFLVFTLFICFNGSELTTASAKLMPAAFYSNWYDGDLAYRKMMLFFLMRSGEPQVLRAYKFTTVSMQTFMAILKLSYQLYLLSCLPLSISGFKKLK